MVGYRAASLHHPRIAVIPNLHPHRNSIMKVVGKGCLFVLAFAAHAAALPLPPPPPSCSGQVNALPVLDGDAGAQVAAVANGTKWWVTGANLSVPLTVLHLYGGIYDMHFAYGQLMAAEIADLVPATLAYIYAAVNASYNLTWLPEPVRDWVIEAGVEVALDWTANATAGYSPPHWAEAVAGLAAGSGVAIADLRRVAMIAEWTRASCSMFGAWGPASAAATGGSGGLVQLRALDWDTDGPFQQWPVLAVFHPDARTGGFANAQLGWAGMIGAITGVSASGVGISEKVWDAYTGPYTPFGYAWNFLLADSLMFDADTDAVLSRIASANRTCSIWIGVGDVHGNGGGGSFKAVAYSSTTVDIFNDKSCATYPNHDRFDSLLFINKHVQPSDEPCMNDLMHAAYGAFSGALTAAYVTALEQTGDMHIMVLDWAADELLVSNASPGGGVMAYDAPFVRFSLAALLAKGR